MVGNCKDVWCSKVVGMIDEMVVSMLIDGYSGDKNHKRMTYHFVCSLSFVLILEEITHRIKNGHKTPTMTDHSSPHNSTITHIIHQVQH